MHFPLFHKKKINITVLLTCFLAVVLNGQQRYLHFSEIDGLPRNITTCLEQDKYGYLWIGTGNGIVRYDGRNFSRYKELEGTGIIYLHYDSKNTLWVANGEGLYRYNGVTNYFEQIVRGFISKIDEDNGEIYFLMLSDIQKTDGKKITHVFSGNNITDFCFSDEGIWTAKNNDGISLLSRESSFKKEVKSHLKDKSVNIIRKIDDKLLAGCYNGQLYAILKNDKIVQKEISNHYYFKEMVRIGQEIWLATDGNGIIILDSNLQYLRTLNKNQNTSASINSNSIYDIFRGTSDEIWLASFGAGLTCILPDNLLFHNILPEKGNKNTLVANEGVSVFINEPEFFFGTNYGLSEWNENTGQFKNLFSERLRNDLKGTKVTAVLSDQDKNKWIGTYDGLLGKYDENYHLLKIYRPSSMGTDEMQQIVQLKQISRTNMLILTQFHSRILLNFNIEQEKSELFELFSKGSGTTYFLLNCIRENQQGELLALISDRGLFRVNTRDNILEDRFQAVNERLDSYVSDFYHDNKGNYWFATSNGGLLCISEDGENFQKWTVKDGLPSNTLIRIESNDDRILWISTISGICRFDTQTGQSINFNHNDGLPASEFLERVSSKTDDGKIVFGSAAGFTIIDPSKFRPDTSRTEVIISDITFQNQSIRNPNEKKLLDLPLEETKELWLPYQKNSFSIHFFSKEKSFIKYHTYAYRLAGLEKSMNFIGETNYVTYTNLSPGTYTFQIKSTNKTREGIPTNLIIHIQPPWYFSWYAYTGYAILFFTIIYLAFYSYTKKLQVRKEKEISEYKIQKEHELTEKKLAFFTNISHDLKTPLTLIDAPVNDLLQSGELSREQVNKLMLISRNSKRLYKLISDLLDFRKITQKQYVLQVKEEAIYKIIANVYEPFQEECKNKSIDFQYSVDNQLVGFIDADKIEKILWNLLSNALKFTNPGGSIRLTAEELYAAGIRKIRMTVSDKGIGISKDDQDKIFNRFFKGQTPEKVNKGGTGIGLSIVKELVELHHGEISVESVPGAGATFTITIPAAGESYLVNEIVEVEQSDAMKQADHPESEPQELIRQKRYNLPVLLVVEDNPELREYLAEHFEKKYKVCQAEDGFGGLSAAKEINPDIILTDIQMPKMNGYEFCKEIRRHFETSHIPVVMLTANDTTEQQIEGLSTGADSYITKPFEIKLLDTVLNTLLENRKKIRDKLLGFEIHENLEKSLPKKDIDFLSELKLFIEEHMMSQELNVELLAQHFAVGLTQLHKKIKSLTGSTPNNLIKSIRLKKAYQFIREEGMRVSEAAYQTGFNDPNYFTTCFKKEFGENPSQVG